MSGENLVCFVVRLRPVEFKTGNNATAQRGLSLWPQIKGEAE